MHEVRMLGTWGLLAFVCLAHAGGTRAQTPAPVENVSTLPPRSPEDERKALHVPPGFLVQLVARERKRKNQPNPSPITMKATGINSDMTGWAAEDSFRIFTETHRTTDGIGMAK